MAFLNLIGLIEIVAVVEYFCIREDIPSKLILTKMTIEGFFVEINLRKKRWLLCCSYNPKKPLISEHLNEIGKNLDLLLSKYDNFMLIGSILFFERLRHCKLCG